jgi:hypothetical protein
MAHLSADANQAASVVPFLMGGFVSSRILEVTGAAAHVSG